MSEQAEYPYDVFISYSHADQVWVWDKLLPRLEGAGLKVCIDDRDFEPGVPSLVNMQNAVERSCKTLIVLTPAWVDSEWTALESLLIQTADPASRGARMIPLWLKPCEPPKRIAMLTYVDFTQPSEFEPKLQRLVAAIRDEPMPDGPRPAPVRAPAKETQAADVRTAMATFRAVFQVACEQIDVLGNYKDLHNQLHGLQFGYNLIVLEARLFSDDETTQEILEDLELTLQGIVHRLRYVVDRSSFAASEISWIQSLDLAREKLHGAAKNSDMEQLEVAIRLVKRVLDVQPSQINARLNTLGSGLDSHLSTLVKTMKCVRDKLAQSDLDSEKIRQFEADVDALNNQGHTLIALINDHNDWQVVDLELRRIEANIGQVMDELEMSWPDLKDLTTQLCKDRREEWVEPFKEDSEKLESAIVEQDPAEVKRSFRRFRRQVDNRFYQIDMMLKKLCDGLRNVDGPLASVLRVIE